MADSEQVETSAEANGANDHNDAISESPGDQYQSLAGDKEELPQGQKWKEIKVAEASEEDGQDINGSTEPPEDEHDRATPKYLRCSFKNLHLPRTLHCLKRTNKISPSLKTERTNLPRPLKA